MVRGTRGLTRQTALPTSSATSRAPHHASLVVLTGWGQDEDGRRVREAGFDHHLVKPADLGTL